MLCAIKDTNDSHNYSNCKLYKIWRRTNLNTEAQRKTRKHNEAQRKATTDNQSEEG